MNHFEFRRFQQALIRQAYEVYLTQVLRRPGREYDPIFAQKGDSAQYSEVRSEPVSKESPL
jgi:hypothetical protein